MFELDDLPDPRLYPIDVAQLHEFARQSDFDPSYQNYLIQVEKDYLAKIQFDNFLVSIDLLVNGHLDNLLLRRFKKPNPVMFFPSALSTDGAERKKQMHCALYKYVIRLDMHITDKDDV